MSDHKKARITLNEFIAALRERPDNLSVEEEYIATHYGNLEHVQAMCVVGPTHYMWGFHSVRLYTPLRDTGRFVEGSLQEVEQ